MLSVYTITLICLITLQIYIKNKLDVKSSYFKFPATNYIIVFNAAIGEEFIFRILPHLISSNHFEIRVLFSSLIFGLLHCHRVTTWSCSTTLHKVSFNEIVCDKNFVVITAMIMGLFLILIEDLFENPIYWYITCCIIHGLNNVLYIYNNNKRFVFSSGSDKRFIMAM